LLGLFHSMHKFEFLLSIIIVLISSWLHLRHKAAKLFVASISFCRVLEIPIVWPFVEVPELIHFLIITRLLIIKMNNLTEQNISLKEQELTLKIQQYYNFDMSSLKEEIQTQLNLETAKIDKERTQKLQEIQAKF